MDQLRNSLLIIGSRILVDDTASVRYIKENKLLDILEWTLQNGSQKYRSDTFWILQNLACCQEASGLILMLKPKIIELVLSQVVKRDIKLKNECCLLIQNLLKHC